MIDAHTTAIVHRWDTDEAYIADQNTDNSWSHETEWGECAAMKFMMYGDRIKELGYLYHDDTAADFGGNDGFAANQFYLRHGIKPMVIDCEPRRLAFAKQEYGLEILRCFLEDIPLSDNSIDWGFCSHTMEHTRDVDAALSEIARVIKRACWFILPLETVENALKNPAHSVACPTLKEWRRLMKPYWVIKGTEVGSCRGEARVFAIPRKLSKVSKVPKVKS